MFFFVPGIFVALSLASDVLVVTVACVLFLLVMFIAIVSYFQNNNPSKLPKCLQTWQCLPTWMRSFEPIDRLCCAKLAKTCKCCCQPKDEDGAGTTETDDAASAEKLAIAKQRLETEPEPAAELL